MNRREIFTGPGVQSGPEVKPEIETAPEIKGITERDLRVVLPDIGETTIVLQRNAKDERNPESANYGALTPEAAEKTRNDAKAYFEKILQGLPPEERNQVEILVVASDATLVAPEGAEFYRPHKRGLETASEVMKGAREALVENGAEESQLLNLSEFADETSPDGPVEFKDLEDLQMLSQSPEFVEHLKSKYGTGKDFWVAYETDKEKEKRKELGVEGVSEIAERIRSFLELLAQGGIERHSRIANKRLIIWAVSHYDAVSPFVKVNVLKKPATDYLPINAGGGLTLEISKPEIGSGKKVEAKTELSGQRFDVRL